MKKNITICLFAFTWLIAGAQEYLVPSTGTNTIKTCSGKIYDSGGPTGNYSNSSEGILIVEPNDANSAVILYVNQFQYESCCDNLRIYPNGTPTGINNQAQINNSYLSEAENGILPFGSLLMVR